MPQTAVGETQELDVRDAGNGVEVRLVWSKELGCSVQLVRNGDVVDTIPVPEGGSASEVFMHPLTYTESNPWETT